MPQLEFAPLHNTNNISSEPDHIPRPRIAGLDAIRGIAALAVTIYHLTSTGYDRLYPRPDNLLRELDLGRQAVSLFFMVSGFVILMSLDRSKKIRDYAFSRFSRLYPTYWAAVVMTFLAVHICGLPGREFDVKIMAINMSMLPTVFAVPRIDPVYWTLHVELYFYILMAVIVAVGLRRQIVFALVTIVLGDMLYHLFDLPIDLPGSWRFKDLPDNMHWFTIGVLFYEARNGWRPTQIVILCICLLGGFYSTYVKFESVLQAAFALSLVLLMWAGTQSRTGFLGSRVLLFFGAVSYPLYLLHNNIGVIVIRAGYRCGLPECVSVAIAFLFVLTLACLVTFTIERPATKYLRDRYKRRLARRASPEDVASTKAKLTKV